MMRRPADLCRKCSRRTNRGLCRAAEGYRSYLAHRLVATRVAPATMLRSDLPTIRLTKTTVPRWHRGWVSASTQFSGKLRLKSFEPVVRETRTKAACDSLADQRYSPGRSASLADGSRSKIPVCSTTRAFYCNESKKPSFHSSRHSRI